MEQVHLQHVRAALQAGYFRPRRRPLLGPSHYHRAKTARWELAKNREKVRAILIWSLTNLTYVYMF